MSNHLATINDNIALQTKHQRIDWAFANTEKDASSFDYYVKPDSYMFNGKKSTEAVKVILTAFRKGKSVDIHKYSKYTRDRSANDEDGAEFRVAISEQLESLLGTPPRIVSHKGKWTINLSINFQFSCRMNWFCLQLVLRLKTVITAIESDIANIVFP